MWTETRPLGNFFHAHFPSYANKLHKVHTTVRLSNACVFYFVSTTLKCTSSVRVYGRVRWRSIQLIGFGSRWEGRNRGGGEFYTLFETHNPSSAHTHTHTIVVKTKKFLGKQNKKSHNEVSNSILDDFLVKTFAYPVFYAENRFEFLLVFIRQFNVYTRTQTFVIKTNSERINVIVSSSST